MALSRVVSAAAAPRFCASHAACLSAVAVVVENHPLRLAPRVITVCPRPPVSWLGASSKTLYRACFPIPLPITTLIHGAARSRPPRLLPTARAHAPSVPPREGQTQPAASGRPSSRPSPERPFARPRGAPVRAPTRLARCSARPTWARPSSGSLGIAVLVVFPECHDEGAPDRSTAEVPVELIRSVRSAPSVPPDSWPDHRESETSSIRVVQTREGETYKLDVYKLDARWSVNRPTALSTAPGVAPPP